MLDSTVYTAAEGQRKISSVPAKPSPESSSEPPLGVVPLQARPVLVVCRLLGLAASARSSKKGNLISFSSFFSEAANMRTSTRRPGSASPSTALLSPCKIALKATNSEAIPSVALLKVLRSSRRRCDPGRRPSLWWCRVWSCILPILSFSEFNLFFFPLAFIQARAQRRPPCLLSAAS